MFLLECTSAAGVEWRVFPSRWRRALAIIRLSVAPVDLRLVDPHA